MPCDKCLGEPEAMATADGSCGWCGGFMEDPDPTRHGRAMARNGFSEADADDLAQAIHDWPSPAYEAAMAAYHAERRRAPGGA